VQLVDATSATTPGERKLAMSGMTKYFPYGTSWV
jgi:hypothetical protein